MQCFLKIQAETQGEIQGSCDIKEKVGWIEIYNFDHKVEMAKENPSNMPMGRHLHHNVNIRKQIDRSTIPLYRMLCQGEKIKVAEFEWYTHAKGLAKVYYKVKLEEAVVTSIRPAAQVPEPSALHHPMPMEEVSFAYEKITWTWVPTGSEYQDNNSNSKKEERKTQREEKSKDREQKKEDRAKRQEDREAARTERKEALKAAREERVAAAEERRKTREERMAARKGEPEPEATPDPGATPASGSAPAPDAPSEPSLWDKIVAAVDEKKGEVQKTAQKESEAKADELKQSALEKAQALAEKAKESLKSKFPW